MSWLRAKLRDWLGIDRIGTREWFHEVELPETTTWAPIYNLLERVARLEEAQNAVLSPTKVATKNTKPYRTASEVRNKLERSTDEKA